MAATPIRTQSVKPQLLLAGQLRFIGVVGQLEVEAHILRADLDLGNLDVLV